MLQMTLVQPTLEESACIDTRRSVALKIDQIPGTIALATVEEMIETDFGECGGRRVRGDVTAETGMITMGIHYHGHGVPPRETLDAAFEFAITRVRRLVLGRYRVHIRRADGRWQLDPRFPQALRQLAHNQRGMLRPLVLQHIFQDEFERVQPPLVFAAVLVRGDNDRRFRPSRGWYTLLLFFCVCFHNVTRPTVG